MTFKVISSTVFFLFICFMIMNMTVLSQSNDEKSEIANKIKEYETKLEGIRAQKSTLASEITFMDTQMNLTVLKIDETEKKIISTQEEIKTLNSRIEGLDSSLDKLSKLLLRRAVDGYKRQNVTVFDLLLDSGNASNLMSRLKYFRTVQNNNEQLVLQVQQTKLNFEDQKTLRENKKVQLDQLSVLLNDQKVALVNQKAQKQKLLAETKNDETTYQQLLNRAKSEFAAIQGIVAGAGTETMLREVKKGDTIASIIPGASCNSSGGHLHFIVQDGGSVQNPFNYLKSIDYSNNSGNGSDGDPFNPSGNWDWPLSGPITFNQGYGATWSVRNTWVGRIYSFHNGLDINGSSYTVSAVSDGTLYRGSYAVGCALPYMKLVHKDSNISTLYLHVYSQ